MGVPSSRSLTPLSTFFFLQCLQSQFFIRLYLCQLNKHSSLMFTYCLIQHNKGGCMARRPRVLCPSDFSFPLTIVFFFLPVMTYLWLLEQKCRTQEKGKHWLVIFFFLKGNDLVIVRHCSDSQRSGTDSQFTFDQWVRQQVHSAVATSGFYVQSSNGLMGNSGDCTNQKCLVIPYHPGHSRPFSKCYINISKFLPCCFGPGSWRE